MNAANQTTNQASNQTSNQTLKAADIAALSSKLVLISSLINNINAQTVKQDNIFVIAASIGLAASYLAKVAALQEAKEQQIAPGVTTFANNLKIISSSLGLISGILSYWALLIEVSLRAQGIQAPQTQGSSGSSTVSGSLLVQ